MTQTERINFIKVMLDISETDNSENKLIDAHLVSAEKEIIAWRYSYSSNSGAISCVPDELEQILLHAVIAGYSIMGAQGQKTHSENGISRTFKYADMVAYIHANVIPMAGVI